MDNWKTKFLKEIGPFRIFGIVPTKDLLVNGGAGYYTDPHGNVLGNVIRIYAQQFDEEGHVLPKHLWTWSKIEDYYIWHNGDIEKKIEVKK